MFSSVIFVFDYLTAKAINETQHLICNILYIYCTENNFREIQVHVIKIVIPDSFFMLESFECACLKL